MMTETASSIPSSRTAGKARSKSVNGTLIVLLKVTRWILAVTAVTAILAMARVPFFPIEIGGDPTDPNSQTPTMYLGAAFEPESTPAGEFVQGLVLLIFISVGLVFVHHMLKILANVEAGAAFAKDNGRRLRMIGLYGAAAQIAVYIVWILAHAADVLGLANIEGVRVQITTVPWIAILGVFALSRVFAEGTALKEEQDLTV